MYFDFTVLLCLNTFALESTLKIFQNETKNVVSIARTIL